MLRSRPFRNTSMVLTMFTREAGRVDGLVRGAFRRSRSAAQALEPVSLAEVVLLLRESRSLHLVTQSAYLDPLAPLRRNLKKSALAGLAAEMLCLFTEPHHKNDRLFLLSEAFLKNLAILEPTRLRENSLILLWLHTVHVLRVLGLGLDPRICIQCGGTPGLQPLFHIAAGGLLCHACGADLTIGVKLKPQEYALLLDLHTERFKTLCGRTLDVEPWGFTRLLLQFLCYHTERNRPLKSINFVEKTFS